VKNHRTPGQIFAAPVAIGALSTVGLLAALIGDGWWDAVSWLSLALPVLLYVFFVARRRIGAG
jgi:branched-subunit amino acid transport protein AzlD